MKLTTRLISIRFWNNLNTHRYFGPFSQDQEYLVDEEEDDMMNSIEYVVARHILCEKQGKINEPYKKLQDGWLSNGDEVLPAEFAKRMWMDQWLSFKFYERTRVSHTITSTLLHIMKMVVALITETAADALPPMLLDIPKADTSSSVEENVATKIPVSSTTPPNTDELAEKSRLKTETGSTSVRKELFAGPDKELTGLDAKKAPPPQRGGLLHLVKIKK
ncbi:peptidyl-prolyl cis-trans isomerase NIMA-interacting 4 [Artemisia annua]|uniref:peptidylprolyl isomerase n=1 Tax=Artemisia annua TaxID=35608 RepID=A0A2U1NYC3_ARTAN|nr:peptidyl-prolyl cis-trans isomerase NIMA-interacting 4 [Artemisia annua]